MENTTTSPDVLERFLRYVQINTQSEDANCDQVPSSAVQFDLANVLAEELRELGAEDAHVTEHAKISAPTNKRKAAMLWDETPMAEMPFTKIPMLPHISAAISTST